MAYTKDQGFFGRLVRSVIAIVVLSAFVVGIAFSVKSISTVDNKKIASISAKVLAKLNINVDEGQIGEVAGKFAQRLSSTTGAPVEEIASGADIADSNTYSYVGIASDIHDDLASLTRAINAAKDRGVTTMLVLGDLTDFGDIAALTKIKEILVNSGLTYYVIPGDHDLAQSVGTQNFLTVFGPDHHSLTVSGVKMLLLDNAANFTPILPEQEAWFGSALSSSSVVFLSQPLFSDGLSLPFSRMYMGSLSSDVSPDLIDNQVKVKEQRDRLLSELRNSSVKTIVSGDHHKSSTISDPVKDGLSHMVVGAITKEVNDMPQRIVQSPRFTIMKIADDQTYTFEEVLID